MIGVGHPLAAASRVGFFTDHSISDDSTCIYVDSSFSSLSSEFAVDSSELNSSYLHNSERLSLDEKISEPNLDKLRVYYTNADCLLNKIGELQVMIDIVKPDVIVVTELFPKSINPVNIDKNEYKINGFTCYTGVIKENSRGVVIYVREDIKSDYCYTLNNDNFKESVWCEVRMNSKDKLLIGGIYKSPNCDAENHVKLNQLITQAIEMKYNSTVVIGDFNFREINWETWTVNRNETHPASHFVECIRDNFLCQHIDSFTRYREGQDPSCLDLLFTDKENIIDNVKIGDKLGASDHASIIFDVLCTFERNDSQQQRPDFYKADYRSIRTYLQSVDWNEMSDMDTETSWDFFMNKVSYCIEQYVPVKKTNKKFKKPKWMDQYCVRKVKKKYQAWKRFTHSHSYRDYAEYCKLRNSAAKAVKFAKKKYQKGIAESVQKSAKSFWSHVKEEIKSKSSIGDLKDKNGEIKTDNKDKAEILNDFFASAFTVEGDSV